MPNSYAFKIKTADIYLNYNPKSYINYIFRFGSAISAILIYRF